MTPHLEEIANITERLYAPYGIGLCEGDVLRFVDSGNVIEILRFEGSMAVFEQQFRFGVYRFSLLTFEMMLLRGELVFDN